jgi:hypothetical protein
MESSELFSHTEQPEPVPDVETSAEPACGPVFSDRPAPQPRADAPWSS